MQSQLFTLARRSSNVRELEQTLVGRKHGRERSRISLTISMNYYLYTDTGRDTTLSKGMFQSNLGLELRAMHRQYIRWCRTQFGCQKSRP